MTAVEASSFPCYVVWSQAKSRLSKKISPQPARRLPRNVSPRGDLLAAEVSLLFPRTGPPIGSEGPVLGMLNLVTPDKSRVSNNSNLLFGKLQRFAQLGTSSGFSLGT